ncbi:hypothetical protein CI238_05475 [Colletotrichum incanum]|uniref:Uncharacterized protein n=1 Tax=Colletotrichum incanum TaxID=1573173 RepID=A0A162N6N4_COLIC|nr:hypothetical protein CI238_05475 [Colletotrichum incanum]
MCAQGNIRRRGRTQPHRGPHLSKWALPLYQLGQQTLAKLPNVTDGDGEETNIPSLFSSRPAKLASQDSSVTLDASAVIATVLRRLK